MPELATDDEIELFEPYHYVLDHLGDNYICSDCGYFERSDRTEVHHPGCNAVIWPKIKARIAALKAELAKKTLDTTVTI